MYTDNAYWHNKHLDFKDKKHPLFVGSAGVYQLFTRPRLPTHRPRGRLDYQLLYIASGKAHFYFHGLRRNSATTITGLTAQKPIGFILREIT